MFDTHAHLNFKTFENNLDQVIKKSQQAGVEKIVVVGTNLENSKRAIEITQKYEGIYASVGLHPHHVFSVIARNMTTKQSSKVPNIIKIATLPSVARNDGMEKYITQLELLLSQPKVVAVGETGMDRHIYQKTKYQNYQITEQFIQLQKWFFEQQIQLAIKHKKSLIIHNREAVADTLEVLQKNWDQKLSGRSVFHFCEPDERLLNFAIKNHVYIGIDGDVLYDKKKQEFIKKIPLDLLVLETDSPYNTPKSLKSQGEPTNQPKNLTYILETIRQLTGQDNKSLEQITDRNSKSLLLGN